MNRNPLREILNKKILPFAFFGNALEFYEFTIYAIFAPYFAKEFFVTDSEVVSLIISWGGFSVAFITRPLGALVFGYIGDKLGRKIALSFSILVMASATLAIGFLPTYAEAGLFSPITLIVLRMIQGISTGGEYNGAAIYLIEKFQYKNSGFIGGIVTSSCVLGALAGTIFGGWCQAHDLWRAAFIVGGVFGLILFSLRFILTESWITSKEVRGVSAINLLSGKYISKFLSNMLIGGLNGALSYTLFGFSLFYLKKYLGYGHSEALALNISGMTSYFLCNPLFGAIYDKVGGKGYWKMILPIGIASIILAFNLINSKIYLYNMLGILLLGAQAGSVSGPCHAFFQENIVPEIRYRFVSVSFATGMALIGGTTPGFLTFLIEKYDLIYAPCYWIGGLAITTWVVCQIMYKMWEGYSKAFTP